MLSRLISFSDRLISLSGTTVSWLSLIMVLVMFAIVVMRYLFDEGSIAIQESITYLHASVFLVGAAWTLQQDAHVRVDILYNRLGDKGRAVVDLFGSLLLLMPVMLFISYVSWEYVVDSWEIKEGSREAGGLDAVYLLKSLIIVFTVLLMIQGISQALASVLKLLGAPEERQD